MAIAALSLACLPPLFRGVGLLGAALPSVVGGVGVDPVDGRVDRGLDLAHVALV